MTLPTAQQLAAASARTADMGYIFFVEDEDLIADLMTAVFARAGYRAIHACNGAEAMRLAHEHHNEIALALVDVCLPDINGDELCRKLRLLSPGLPVLLTSGRDMDCFRTELEAGGPTAMLSKPYRPAELLAQVRAMWPVAA